MKLILCTLAICVSLLASVFALKAAVREEGKRTRAALSKAAEETVNGAVKSETASQRLDAINNQLAGLSRRMTALEEAMRPVSSAANEAASVQSNLLSIRNDLGTLSAAQAKLDVLPAQLAQLTTFVDQSFEHVDKNLAARAQAEPLAPAIEELAKRIDAIDSYFTQLFPFLGLVYDPSSADLLASYPSVDERLNEINMQLALMRDDLILLSKYLLPRIPQKMTEPQPGR